MAPQNIVSPALTMGPGRPGGRLVTTPVSVLLMACLLEQHRTVSKANPKLCGYFLKNFLFWESEPLTSLPPGSELSLPARPEIQLMAAERDSTLQPAVQEDGRSRHQGAIAYGRGPAPKCLLSRPTSPGAVRTQSSTRLGPVADASPVRDTGGGLLVCVTEPGSFASDSA